MWSETFQIFVREFDLKWNKRDGENEENMEIQSAFSHFRKQAPAFVVVASVKCEYIDSDGNEALVWIMKISNFIGHEWIHTLVASTRNNEKCVQWTMKRQLIYINFLRCHFSLFSKLKEVERERKKMRMRSMLPFEDLALPRR